MEVISARSALLSNFEVLTHLRELESDHLARAKTVQRIKKEEESSGTLNSSAVAVDKGPSSVEVTENLRTVEVEAIQYLSAEYQPTSSQSSAAITQLVKGLDPFELTKAEKLQVVNLAPTEAVELYVIIEELEDRLGERMDDILKLVRKSLKEPVSPPDETQGHEVQYEEIIMEGQEGWVAYGGDMDPDAIANDIEFDDTGEGVGVEGDLDMDDD